MTGCHRRRGTSLSLTTRPKTLPRGPVAFHAGDGRCHQRTRQPVHVVRFNVRGRKECCCGGPHPATWCGMPSWSPACRTRGEASFPSAHNHRGREVGIAFREPRMEQRSPPQGRLFLCRSKAERCSPPRDCHLLCMRQPESVTDVLPSEYRVPSRY